EEAHVSAQLPSHHGFEELARLHLGATGDGTAIEGPAPLLSPEEAVFLEKPQGLLDGDAADLELTTQRLFRSQLVPGREVARQPRLEDRLDRKVFRDRALHRRDTSLSCRYVKQPGLLLTESPDGGNGWPGDRREGHHRLHCYGHQLDSKNFSPSCRRHRGRRLVSGLQVTFSCPRCDFRGGLDAWFLG